MKPTVPILHYLRPYRLRLAVGVLLLLATNAMDKAIPWLLQGAIDALEKGRLEQVKDYALGVVGLAAGLWIVRTRSRVQVFNVGRDVEFDLRNELLRAIHGLGPRFFQRVATGQLMSRATSDLAQIRLLVGFGGLNVVNSLFAFVGAVGLMLAISPELTLWALAPFPLVIVLAQLFGRALYGRSRAAQQALGHLADVAQENLAGVRVVRAYAIEDAEERRFEEANEAAIDANMRLVVLRGLMWPLLMLVGSIGTLLVVWKGGERVVDDTLSVGEFAAFLAYLAQLVWPTLAFGYLLSVVQRGRASYERIREVLDAEPEIVPPAEPTPLAGEGALRVEGLRFAYEGASEPALEDVSFEVPAKGSLAIMGTVGSGKSTLAALLPRLGGTPPGSVFVDGVDVTETEPGELRHVVGYAQQEPFLFSTTVERNIAFGLDDPEAEGAAAAVRRAAEEAAVLDEIEQLPDGFETLVGERGVQLSGGQKQRIALARALLREPAVLVLDDPMSAVDARTEATILRALDRAGEGRTLVLVTHRVAAAARAQQIVVLEKGRVVERGTHAELCKHGGVYAALAARQSLEEELSTL
ncbi:MAG TPA: ABC transporter ATP-binding protein [Polyangiaceae bacterium LLY-WYZ-15_(1-7)]|nr:carbohydrate ABC transporter [Myxococcales bacterium]MAT27732.1 carbohydrate ABC transporter [Sandaracinus sp.]HJK99991.1 ABC transporter ATP-binding protein [Polyangiaceae bacterium LLY-WYZ-15_(1-7)]HJL10363.1 ABC transporter ATP-binding protein [Polyangiaceae bacterium LLY-WYZ-15_(1-7)]HJL22092.1 ABC transporter ATP-binding protein [Polyangiaceae bacterium LLY-WYZ-15_(1-7)]